MMLATSRMVVVLSVMMTSLWLQGTSQGPIVEESSGAPAELEQQVEKYRSSVKRIIDESLRTPQAYRNLGELTTVAPRRLSGSPAAAAAVEWARQTFEKTGFDRVWLEPLMVPHWERGDVGQVKIVEPASHAAELAMLALGGSVATPPEGITAGVIEIRSFDELVEKKDQVVGKIVFYNVPLDVTNRDTFNAYSSGVKYRTQGAVKAARAGAIGSLVRSVTTAVDDVPHTGGCHYLDGTPKIPHAAISSLAANQLSELLATGTPVRIHFSQNCQWHEDKPSFNVIGEYKGSENPEQIVVVGGHLDSWDVGQGAHDDGSGTCHAIEVVRILKQLQLRPRRSIRVIAFMNEENGLRGGKGYYAAHLDEMSQHVLAIESDRGGFTPRGFTTDANAAMPLLQEIATLFADENADLMEKGGGGADISPMKASGVPTVGFLPDSARYFDYHHTDADTFDKVNERELQLGAGVIAALTYVLADWPHAIPRNPIPGG